ncbi:MAG: hypothetical protein NZM07_12360 [Elioraea sp.]|nr:hypothetical protein [Elioraea sp.]
MGDRASGPILQGEIKKGRASLVGGIAVGVAVMILWLALVRDVSGEVSAASLAAGAAVALAIGAYIRIADL